jgi:ribosomal-protein-alanine N-acetyltransferase
MGQETLPTIIATRVCLRWLSQTDIDPLFTVFSDPQVMRYWSTPPLTDREAAVSLLDEIQNSNRQNTIMKWGVALLTNDLLIGTVTLVNLDLSNGRAELGYALGRKHWGNGYMHEALQALLSYAFDVLNLRRLEADVDPRNAASIRTLERLGFQREGLLRERWHVNGEIQDAFFYGLLRREWKKREG